MVSSIFLLISLSLRVYACGLLNNKISEFLYNTVKQLNITNTGISKTRRPVLKKGLIESVAPRKLVQENLILSLIILKVVLMTYTFVLRRNFYASG